MRCRRVGVVIANAVEPIVVAESGDAMRWSSVGGAAVGRVGGGTFGVAGPDSCVVGFDSCVVDPDDRPGVAFGGGAPIIGGGAFRVRPIGIVEDDAECASM